MSKRTSPSVICCICGAESGGNPYLTLLQPAGDLKSGATVCVAKVPSSGGTWTQECCATKLGLWTSVRQCAALAPESARSDDKQPPVYHVGQGCWLCRSHRDIWAERVIGSKKRKAFIANFPAGAASRLLGGGTARLRGETGRRIWFLVTRECLIVKRRRADSMFSPRPLGDFGPETADAICHTIDMESPYDEDDALSIIIEGGLAKIAKATPMVEADSVTRGAALLVGAFTANGLFGNTGCSFHCLVALVDFFKRHVSCLCLIFFRC